MSIENLSPEEIDEKQHRLLEAVPNTGVIGNKALRSKLGNSWSEDLYWTIRNRLIERGLLETGKGRGGSIKKVLQGGQLADTENDEIETEQTTQEYTKEFDLYTPIATVLRNQWTKEQGFDNYLVEITAKQGSKSTGGKWTRPDIIAVGYKTFPYIPGRYLEVITFEIKPVSAIDVAAVYEALAHRRAATQAYLIVHIPKKDPPYDFTAVIEAISDESKKFGIGFIIAEAPDDFDTWEVKLEADRIEPDPYRLNEFIAQQTTQELKEQIVRWFK